MLEPNPWVQIFPMISPKSFQKLLRLPEIYQEFNSRVNLISRRDISNLMLHHVAHSLALCHFTPLQPEHSVLDFGTGGGFPGIPLAIAYPNVPFHLIDSIGKKIRIVHEIARSLDLPNVRVTQIRGELIKAQYTHVISRAVTRLEQLWQWSRHLLVSTPYSTPGVLLAYRGKPTTEELTPFLRHAFVWSIHEHIPNPYFEQKCIIRITQS